MIYKIDIFQIWQPARGHQREHKLHQTHNFEELECFDPIERFSLLVHLQSVSHNYI